ncbi:hypothetical protein [Hirschia maritima]|uniref:hypothetical protein n=1 Tax=Hirschia maritima TaxID=1121961 RepID=UPI0003708964|nr:hypothetical protein [Hirschia maritima]
MELLGVNIWAIVGFAFAAYAVVGNDALQTLGTFINSNRRMPWWILYLFAVAILIASFYYGWVVNGGDVSYGRLDNTNKFPVFEVQWYHTLPPLVLLILTRIGIPVSTTFMVLATFATMAGMQSMLTKSLMGYAVAFATGGLIYAALAPTLERWFLKTAETQHNIGWVILQWMTTGYLWWMWLVQDFANIFVYLPRNIPEMNAAGEMIGREENLTMLGATAGLALISLFLLITFMNRGGPVQKILLTKTSVTDIRSATVIDFIYATLLFVFSGQLEFLGIDKVPMSTTWVFLGLIAGREFSIATIDKVRSTGATAKIVGMDLAKATMGIVISVALALSMPYLAEKFTPSADKTAVDTVTEAAN